MRHAALLVVVLVAAVGSGCGLRHRVDRSMLDRIPPEDKLSLYETENDVLIAKDEKAAARLDLEDAERALDKAGDEVDVLSTRASAEKNQQVANLLRTWGKKKIEWREAEIDLCEARIDSADTALYAARARYERAKAQIVKERTPRQATSISMSDFDSQLKSADSDAKSDQKKTEAVRAARDRKRADYDKVSRQLQSVSGGAYGGPWAD